MSNGSQQIAFHVGGSAAHPTAEQAYRVSQWPVPDDRSVRQTQPTLAL
jgi:hypothetical protein